MLLRHSIRSVLPFLLLIPALLILGAGCTYVTKEPPNSKYVARIVYLSTGTTKAEGERGVAYLISSGQVSGDAHATSDTGAVPHSGVTSESRSSPQTGAALEPRSRNTVVKLPVPGIGGKKAPKVHGVSISPDGTMVAAVTEEGLDVIGIPNGESLFTLPFRAPPRFSQFFSGPVFSGDVRRIGFAVPGLIGPGGAEALHVLIHRLALDGTGGGAPLALPPSANLITSISFSSDGDRGAVWASPPLAERLPDLYAVDFANNKVQPITKELVPLSPAVITSDGKEIIVSALSAVKSSGLDGDVPQLYRINVKSGKARKITRVSQAAALRPLAMAPGGSVLFSVSPAQQPKETQLRLISPQKGATSITSEKSRLIRRLSPGQSLLAASISPDRRLLAYVVCERPSGQDAQTVRCSAKERTLSGSPRERVLARFSQPVDKVGFLSPPMIGWASHRRPAETPAEPPGQSPPRLDH